MKSTSLIALGSEGQSHWGMSPFSKVLVTRIGTEPQIQVFQILVSAFLPKLAQLEIPPEVLIKSSHSQDPYLAIRILLLWSGA